MAAKNRKQGIKILVVDDEPDVVTYLVDLLAGHGYSVTSARDTDEALENVNADKPDLVCLDINMPRRSGLVCYRELKKNPETRDIPVIIVSAFGFPGDFKGDRFATISGEPGIPEPDAFVEKPFKPGELIQAVDSLL